MHEYQMIYPERRIVGADWIMGWYADKRTDAWAKAEGLDFSEPEHEQRASQYWNEVKRYGSITDAIAYLSDHGYATFAR